MKHALLASIVVTCGFAAPAQTMAAPVDCARAERELDRGPFKSWQQAYSYFKRYKGLCSDGVQAEGLSAYKTKLLDQQWSKLGELRRLGAQDPDFLNWILLGTFYDPEEVEINQANTACRLLRRLKACSAENRQLCEQLASRVGPSREYVLACPST